MFLRRLPPAGADCQAAAGRIAAGAIMRVLALETSCDETAAAVVDDGPRLLSNVIHTQVPVHARYGGVVPEVASREHLAHLLPTLEAALAPLPGGLDAIDALAVTRGPGLLGSLLVGMQFIKGLALARDLPWLGVNHLEGHLSASLLEPPPPPLPHVALIVSGGHTQLVHVRRFGDYRSLGHSRDDAAGEAFDKVAKALGLGYPGGAAVEALAEGGDPAAVPLPRAWLGRGSLEFSFSGLKTAAGLHLRRQGVALTGVALADFCASLQEAIVDVLSRKAILAAQQVQAGGVVLAGGVAANGRLRTLLASRCARAGLWSRAPQRALCTDNAAMIGAAGWMRLQAGCRSGWETPSQARWPLVQLAPPGAVAGQEPR